MNKIVFPFILLSLTLLLTSCLSIISKTPKGIETKALLNLQIPNETNLFTTLSKNDSALAKKYKCNIIHQLEFGMNAHRQYNNWINIPATNDTISDIYRGIEIWPFPTTNDALEQYLNYRNNFNRDTSARIYKEEKSSNNRCFIIYKTIRFDYNHGIPCGIINDPELVLGFLINKYFICITYTKYSLSKKTSENYVIDINNDINFVSTFFKDVIINNKDRK